MVRNFHFSVNVPVSFKAAFIMYTAGGWGTEDFEWGVQNLGIGKGYVKFFS